MADDEQEISITYETLFELLRREKAREELQRLSPTFFKDLVKYLQEKVSAMKTAQKDHTFAVERDRAIKELENIRKMVRDLYEKREKKIILTAVNRSRTKSVIVDSSAMLPEELAMFNELVKRLDSYREGILNNVLNTKLPAPTDFVSADDYAEPQPASFEDSRNGGNDSAQNNFLDSSEQKEIKEVGSLVLLRFLEDVEEFMGAEMETYGPFKIAETAKLPEEVAEVLVNTGRAERVY